MCSETFIHKVYIYIWLSLIFVYSRETLREEFRPWMCYRKGSTTLPKSISEMNQTIKSTKLSWHSCCQLVSVGCEKSSWSWTSDFSDISDHIPDFCTEPWSNVQIQETDGEKFIPEIKTLVICIYRWMTMNLNFMNTIGLRSAARIYTDKPNIRNQETTNPGSTY